MALDRVGFVGVGLMGRGMARNIVEKGHPLTIVAHRNREPVEDLKSRGAREAADLHELAAQSDIVVLCVTGSPQVEATLTGPGGLASAGKQLVVCDCSTSDPSSTVKLAASLAPQGITLKATQPTQVLVEGADKEVVGQVAAEIRSLRKPEPYKGKGIKYVGEKIRRKAGKAGGK